MAVQRLKPNETPTPTHDPLNINARIYRQVGELLGQLETGEHITLKERVAALVAISRIQVLFVTLRKEKAGDDNAGAAVRKYATAFSNDARGRKKGARPGAAAQRPDPEPATDWFEHAEIDDDDGDGDDDDAA